MSWFGGLKKKNKKSGNSSLNGSRNISRSSDKNQRVHTYYTPSKSQIESFERQSSSVDKSKKPKRGLSILGGNALYYVIAALAVVAVLYSMYLSGSTSIVINDDSRYRTAEQYQKVINDAHQVNLQNMFKPTFDGQQLQNTLSEDLPEATKVLVYAPVLGSKIVVKIDATKPFAVITQSDSPSYIMDNQGKIVVDIKDSIVDIASLPVIKNATGIKFNVGDQIFKPDEMEALIALQYQYASSGPGAGVTYVLPTVIREIRVEDASYYVKYSLSDEGGSTTQQYGALRAVQDQISKQGIGGKQPTEYIDVRLADKVYIK